MAVLSGAVLSGEAGKAQPRTNELSLPSPALITLRAKPKPPCYAGYSTDRLRLASAPRGGGGIPAKWQGWCKKWGQKSHTCPWTKIKLPKIPVTNFRGIKMFSKQRQSQNTLGFTLFAELRGQAYAGTITNPQIVLNTHKIPSYIKLPKKIFAKFFLPKKSQNAKFQTQKTKNSESAGDSVQHMK